jgi:hypothetical protein
VTDHAPGPVPAADTQAGPTAHAGSGRAARRTVTALLLAAAALDLARCGLAVATGRHPAPAGALIAVGLAAAAVSGWTARGCLAGRRWPTGAALLIGAASAPQAAMSGFHAPYAIPDMATVVLGTLLAVAVLATADLTTPGRHNEDLAP